jgi:hypothetical protein
LLKVIEVVGRVVEQLFGEPCILPVSGEPAQVGKQKRDVMVAPLEPGRGETRGDVIGDRIAIADARSASGPTSSGCQVRIPRRPNDCRRRCTR